MKKITELGVLQELDLASKGVPGKFFPEVAKKDKVYNFFHDLENGYCKVAGSRIHVFADSTNWAIVFESNGYHISGLNAEVTLNYIGNCIKYPTQKLPLYSIISNTVVITLIDFMEFERIRNKTKDKSDPDELIDKNCHQIKIRDKNVSFVNSSAEFEKIGGAIRKFRNPHKLLSFGDVVRLYNEIQPALVSATENEIRSCIIPPGIPKIITIQDFHYVSVHSKGFLPSKQETYLLLAKIIVAQDASEWKPTLAANNHWKNWTSGNL